MDAIDRALDGAEERGLALHFVERDGIGTADQCVWVVARGIEHIEPRQRFDGRE
ncbi:MAG: hypothetical protein IT293_14635 [Deltaproteobacteria bacterium]|nr:hypothetical protein [Deltaproteobacteria bacterium]